MKNIFYLFILKRFIEEVIDLSRIIGKMEYFKTEVKSLIDRNYRSF
jgi:hypothetical protein